MLSEKEKLENFDNWRKDTIDLLTDGAINKIEFLDLNYDYIKKLDLKPYAKIQNMMEGIYNYQYYNIMAKRSNNQANKYLHNPKKKRLYSRYINDRENYYCLKDLTTSSIIRLTGYNNIKSYYIKLLSKRLEGKIFEIVLLDYEKLILHSKNDNILKDLKDHHVFDDTVHLSKIHDYVNRSY
ncbi:MAG: hypothetical protein PUG67_06285 [Peptoniphilaceae bacterium]|nr:hypothetical protein [Peptoniphilaceae bacterium]MDY6018665.1 DUF6648 family protein [Anaerococcus sp.]